MVQLSLHDVQSVELDLLKSLKKICDDNNWVYSLGGGTLLGAIRHNGFIPWDDDIDVMMPRPDYDRFIEYCINNDNGFRIHCHECDDSYLNLFATISDLNTRIISEDATVTEIEMGISIDIFPIDGLGNSYLSAMFTFLLTSFARELLVAKKWNRYFRSRTHPLYYEPLRILLFLISRFVNPKILINYIEKINTLHNYSGSKYAGCVSGSYRFKEIMTKNNFSSNSNHIFEGDYYRIIDGYDNYLRRHYGAYLVMPPKERQVSHHLFKAYKIDRN